MSDGHGDQPADVRSFLPRPGEPVDQYAERLRALHRDLTLVLQAVERGLATAAHPGDVAPPVPAHEPIEIVPEPVDEPDGSPAPPLPPRSRMPRVEVMPAPSGEQRRDGFEERREPPAVLEGAPARPAPPFPSRPSAASEEPQPEPRWIERDDGEDEGFTAPTFPPVQHHRLQISPLVASAVVAAWLVVVGLLVALLVS